jgi:hypothetical protein
LKIGVGELRSIAQRQLDGGDFLGRATLEIGNGALAGLLALPITLAQPNRLIDLAVFRLPGCPRDLHVHIISKNMHICQAQYEIYACPHYWTQNHS